MLLNHISRHLINRSTYHKWTFQSNNTFYNSHSTSSSSSSGSGRSITPINDNNRINTKTYQPALPQHIPRYDEECIEIYKARKQYNLRKALKIWFKHRIKGNQPHSITINELIILCNHHNKWYISSALYRRLSYYNVSINSNMCLYLLATYIHLQRPHMVDEMINRIHTYNTFTIDTYTVLIGAYCRMNNIEQVLKWVRIMTIEKQYTISASLLTHVLMLCIHYNMYDTAIEIFQKSTVQPDIGLYDKMIRLYILTNNYTLMWDTYMLMNISMKNEFQTSIHQSSEYLLFTIQNIHIILLENCLRAQLYDYLYIIISNLFTPIVPVSLTGSSDNKSGHNYDLYRVYTTSYMCMTALQGCLIMRWWQYAPDILRQLHYNTNNNNNDKSNSNNSTGNSIHASVYYSILKIYYNTINLYKIWLQKGQNYGLFSTNIIYKNEFINIYNIQQLYDILYSVYKEAVLGHKLTPLYGYTYNRGVTKIHYQHATAGAYTDSKSGSSSSMPINNISSHNIPLYYYGLYTIHPTTTTTSTTTLTATHSSTIQHPSKGHNSDPTSSLSHSYVLQLDLRWHISYMAHIILDDLILTLTASYSSAITATDSDSGESSSNGDNDSSTGDNSVSIDSNRYVSSSSNSVSLSSSSSSPFTVPEGYITTAVYKSHATTNTSNTAADKTHGTVIDGMDGTLNKNNRSRTSSHFQPYNKSMQYDNIRILCYQRNTPAEYTNDDTYLGLYTHDILQYLKDRYPLLTIEQCTSQSDVLMITKQAFTAYINHINNTPTKKGQNYADDSLVPTPSDVVSAECERHTECVRHTEYADDSSSGSTSGTHHPTVYTTPTTTTAETSNIIATTDNDDIIGHNYDPSPYNDRVSEVVTLTNSDTTNLTSEVVSSATATEII